MRGAIRYKRGAVEILRATASLGPSATVGIPVNVATETQMLVLRDGAGDGEGPAGWDLGVLPAEVLNAGDGCSAVGGGVWSPAVVVAHER